MISDVLRAPFPEHFAQSFLWHNCTTFAVYKIYIYIYIYIYIMPFALVSILFFLQQGASSSRRALVQEKGQVIVPGTKLKRLRWRILLAKNTQGA